MTLIDHHTKAIRIKLFAKLLLTALGIIGVTSIAQGQISKAVIQEVIDGDQVYIQTKQAKVKDQANFGEVISTKESRAAILFNNGAQGRLGDNAQVTVGQCVDIEKGELLISGPVNGCIDGLTVEVKGTLYLLKKKDNDTGTIQVLEGTIQVKNQNKPGQLEVKAGQQCEILRGVYGPAIPMSQEEIVTILKGKLFKDFQIPVTTDDALNKVCSKLLPGLSCSSSGLPSYPLPLPSIPVPLPFTLPY